MLVAAPVGVLAAHALPLMISAAPVDPANAALAELMAASHAVDGAKGREAFDDALLAWVRLCVRLHDGLIAEHGDERGTTIWKAAMDRHHAWYGELHGL